MGKWAGLLMALIQMDNGPWSVVIFSPALLPHNILCRWSVQWSMLLEVAWWSFALVYWFAPEQSLSGHHISCLRTGTIKITELDFPCPWHWLSSRSEVWSFASMHVLVKTRQKFQVTPSMVHEYPIVFYRISRWSWVPELEITLCHCDVRFSGSYY